MHAAGELALELPGRILDMRSAEPVGGHDETPAMYSTNNAMLAVCVPSLTVKVAPVLLLLAA